MAQNVNITPSTVLIDPKSGLPTRDFFLFVDWVRQSVSEATSPFIQVDAVQTLTNKTLTAPVITSPSGLTKSDVGLGSVNNTSDAAKPVSTAQQTALDLKADLASPTFTGTVAGITKSMVGLGNVDNTSDATKNAATATLTGKTLTVPILTSYTVLGLPSASPAAQLAYVSNETGGAVVAFSDGSSWRRLTDRAVVS